MAILIITALDQRKKGYLTSSIMRWIIDGIVSAGKKHRCVDINTLELKRCLGDQCSNRFFDKASKCGCLKYKECIDDYNELATNKIYEEMVESEAIIFFLGEFHSTCYIFFEEVYKREWKYVKRQREEGEKSHTDLKGKLAGKPYLVIALLERYGYSLNMQSIIEYTIDRNRYRLRMKLIDLFMVNNDNEEYMEEVIPPAIRVFSTEYGTFHKDKISWFK